MTLGAHFDEFIATQIREGRFASASEVVSAGLRILKDNAYKIRTLRRFSEEGENSGTAEYNYKGLMSDRDDELGE